MRLSTRNNVRVHSPSHTKLVYSLISKPLTDPFYKKFAFLNHKDTHNKIYQNYVD